MNMSLQNVQSTQRMKGGKGDSANPLKKVAALGSWCQTSTFRVKGSDRIRYTERASDGSLDSRRCINVPMASRT